jgi:hypothetical protein
MGHYTGIEGHGIKWLALRCQIEEERSHVCFAALRFDGERRRCEVGKRGDALALQLASLKAPDSRDQREVIVVAGLPRHSGCQSQ